MECGNYAKEQKNEENVFNDADHYIKVATNKKPEFENIEVTGMTVNSATVKVRATDGDGEKLTYKLFYGLDKENLEEKDKKENVDQGIDVEFQITGIDTTKIYYYKIDVLDQYATVSSQVSTLTNKKPEIVKAEVIDVTKTTAKAVIQGTDADVEDKLTYKIYVGTDKSTLETNGKVVQKENILSGKEETLEIKELTPGTKYFYKIAITDGKQTVYKEGEITTIENNAPSIATVEQTDTQTNSFTITAVATDSDGDKLTYKVYTGNTKDNITNLVYTSPATNSRRQSYNNTKNKCSRRYGIVL